MKKRITLEHLTQLSKTENYDLLYQTICERIDSGRLKPIKASGTNGKKPALYQEYWMIEEEVDYTGYMEELQYRLVPQISIDYYLCHLPEYHQDRKFVLLLNEYFRQNSQYLEDYISVNERSYEIWYREKFLKREQGRRILKRCGVEPSQLNYYETSEPLAYYSRSREVPQQLLILENKDTFYSMRQHLLSGGKTIFGEKIETVIYGAGKGILRSFSDFTVCAEPYMNHIENNILYFGDLDYEGIGIYEKLAELFGKQCDIRPFVSAYQEMLKKAFFGAAEEKDALSCLPEMKEEQNQNIKDTFFSCFDKETIGRMQKILSEGRYIPQEILNIRDFS